MSSEIVYSTVKQALALSVSPVPVLDYEDLDPQLQQGDLPFLALEEDFADESLMTMGCPATTGLREDGTFTIHVFVLATEGLEAARILADTIRDWMRLETLDQGIEVLATHPAYPSASNSGRWSSMELMIEYQRNFEVPFF